MQPCQSFCKDCKKIDKKEVSELRKLTSEEINKLANRVGVRKIPAENFLMSITNNINKQAAFINLVGGAKLYNWNQETIQAIADGIKLANKKEQTPDADGYDL
jgi:hypothetical protein